MNLNLWERIFELLLVPDDATGKEQCSVQSLVIMIFNIVHFHSISHNSPRMVYALLTCLHKFQAVYGWGGSVLIFRNMLSSLTRHICSYSSTFKRDILEKHWDGIWAALEFYEEFIFFCPKITDGEEVHEEQLKLHTRFQDARLFFDDHRVIERVCAIFSSLEIDRVNADPSKPEFVCDKKGASRRPSHKKNTFSV